MLHLYISCFVLFFVFVFVFLLLKKIVAFVYYVMFNCICLLFIWRRRCYQLKKLVSDPKHSQPIFMSACVLVFSFNFLFFFIYFMRITYRQRLLVTLLNIELDFYSASSLIQQFADRIVVPLGHIILIPSQPVVLVQWNSVK